MVVWRIHALNKDDNKGSFTAFEYKTKKSAIKTCDELNHYAKELGVNTEFSVYRQENAHKTLVYGGWASEEL